MLLKIVIAVLLLGYGCIAQGQSRYRFHTLGVEQGLTSDVVWSICKDKFGYVWMATQNGLNRYDGHNIKQYFHNKLDSFSIPGNVVYWVHKDIEGGLWFSLGPNGVARYNYSLDRFEKFTPYDSIVKRHNYNTKMWRICNDQQGRIYFANGSSCFRYSLQTKKIEDLTSLFKGKLVGHDIGMFVPQGKNALWVTSNNGIFKINLSDNSLSHYPFDADKYGFSEPNMHDAEFVNDYLLLIAVTRTGFVFFDTRTATYRMPPAPINPSDSKLFSSTGGVLRDAKGRIWLANSRYGLLEYLPVSNTVYSLKNEATYPYPHPEQEGGGLNVYEDNEGYIWYGSSGKGVIWFKPEMDFLQTFERDYSKQQTLPNNNVSYFLPLQNNTVLIGTANGLSSYNKTTRTFSNFPVAYKDADSYPHGNIRGMLQHGDSVFITTGYGLSIYNLKTGKFSRYIDKDPAFDSTFIWGQWLLHKIDGAIFLSGAHPARFNLIKKKYEYTAALTNTEPVYGLSDINASMLDEATGTLWLEAGKGLLYSYQLAAKKLKKHSFTTDSVVMIDAIKKDTKGRLWLGTYNGLYCYDPATGKGEKIILNTSAQEVHSVAVQDEQYIWLATSKEVVRYDRIHKTTHVITSNSFLKNSRLTPRAFWLDNEGILWLGTNKGFATIDTRRFQTTKTIHQPQLVNFYVLDKPKAFDNPLPLVQKIVLNHNENFFSFSLSAFNFRDPAEYSFMLEGFDKDWQPAPGNSGSYTNVPPGTYKLRIKSTNETGGWVERTSPVVIVIKFPFWQRWWFILLMAVAAAFALAFFYSLYKKRKSKRRMEETIDYFANSNYGENSINEICWDIARNCTARLKLEDCVVYLVDDKQNLLVRKAAYGLNTKEQEAASAQDIKPGEGIVGTVATTGKAVMSKNTLKDSRYIVGDAQRLSELAVPILHEGKTIGVIDSEHSRKNYFEDKHVKVLSTIAAIVASKIAEAKAEEAAKESEIQLLEIKKLYAESQLMALRAQMNPHFVFNCLNSIQECIVTQKYGEASLYLNKFAKLFRSVLNNSGRVFVTLAEEIEVLDLYLTLEHMRFEKSFVYSIETDEELEAEEILIPSMLLQPYVENALWHGLMHKEGGRNLLISFNKKEDDVFECVIDDNGIGRKKALELKEQQSKTKRHVSRGMTISKDRIDLLKKQGQHAMLTIVDKYDDEEKATGTKVVIELSAFLQ